VTTMVVRAAPELELLLAVDQATEEFDAFLRRLDEDARRWGFRDGPHPWMGMGASARDIASVIRNGETRDTYWQRRMDEAGVKVVHGEGRSYEEARALVDQWWSEWDAPTPNETAIVVHALRRAKARGLVAHNPALRLWILTDAGDAEIASES
jgi:hypothetical protein